MSNLFSNIKVTLYNIITLMTVPVKVQLEKKKERNHSKNLKKSCHLITKSCLKFCDPWCSTPGFPVLHYLPEFAKFMSIESVMLCNHLILCCFPSPLYNEFLWFEISDFFSLAGVYLAAAAAATCLCPRNPAFSYYRKNKRMYLGNRDIIWLLYFLTMPHGM